MKRLALAITALTLGVAGASAQSQTGEGGPVMLTPEQRAAVRSIVRERLPDELREKLADRLAERLENAHARAAQRRQGCHPGKACS